MKDNKNVKVAQETPPTVSPKDFWFFDYCNNFELKPASLAGRKLKVLNEDIAYFYGNLLNSAIHPSIVKSGICGENWESCREIFFDNIRIDISTIKILFTFLPKVKVISLKLANNHLNLKSFETIIQLLLTTANNIYSFGFEWNNQIEVDVEDRKEFISLNVVNQENPNLCKAQELLYYLFEPFNKLEAVSLRGCYLGDEVMKEIFSRMKTNKTIKVLNLYKNNLTNNSLDSLCNMFLVNRTLEEINLGGNMYDDESISKLKDYIGIYEMNQTDIDKYENLKKEINDIIAANKKAKKGQQKELPFIDEMIEKDGKSYIVKNNIIKKIDFMLCNLTQKSFKDILYILDNNPDLILVLDLLKYDKDSVLCFIDQKKKYVNQVFLAK